MDSWIPMVGPSSVPVLPYSSDLESGNLAGRFISDQMLSAARILKLASFHHLITTSGMLMAHVITTSVILLLLLLCSASFSGATSTEHNVMTTSSESSGDKQDNANINKELEKETTKYPKGRKMGGFEVQKDSTETGKVTETETKPVGSSTKDANEKGTGSKTELSKILAQPGANQNLEPHNNGDVVMEIFNMLKKDYAQKARRRGPINNALPLDDEEP
ncbi:hypothetical protein FCM35_KLT05061 [Carex littledalei]|uniref:Uncharacterized protein n=1 Tax=Carex littledalei TaxID=544730 RepID=A0A833VK93_9POAL|nr:hypothetical protein FCM35_KLT05061 [Carex littledalei]